MSLRFHEIAEGDRRILNPTNEEKLTLVGRLCGLEENMRVLDLASGKGELLVQMAYHHGIRGVGVDISPVFVAAAQDRAYQMDVGDKLNFVVGDAGLYPEPHHAFDVVACIGATWIGGGLAGTIDLMKTALKSDGGLLLIGEPYWYAPAPLEVLDLLEIEP
ncbi:MAG: SAM-dependent methyltransferase, partial [Chloroflexota bacterium]